MTHDPANVMLFKALPTQKSLRASVASIIRTIQAKSHQSDADMADTIGCSCGTIANARNEKADLNAATLARIGAIYGGHYLDPYTALYGNRNVPLHSDIVDALPSVSGAVHSLAMAQSADSPGGIVITHTELLEMLPTLRAASAALTALLVRGESLKVAA
jgi:hypothetical protein